MGARISDEVVTHLADNIRPTCAKSRVCSSLVANASFLERKITVSLAKEVLKAYVQLYRKEISIERIIETVCDHLNIDFARLSSPERTREVAQARQIAMYLSKQHTKAPLTAIGASIGGRNHATVLHSCKAVTNLMETDRNFRRQVEEIEKRILAWRRPDSTITKPRPCEARFFDEYTLRMDQPKIERLLRLMKLLTANTEYTVDDLAERLGMSRRTVYRYIDTFRDAGFVVRKSGACIRLDKESPHFREISQLVHFTEEEAVIPRRAIESIDDTNLLKQNLKTQTLHGLRQQDARPDRGAGPSGTQHPCADRGHRVAAPGGAVRLSLGARRRGARPPRGALRFHDQLRAGVVLRSRGRGVQALQDGPYRARGTHRRAVAL